MQDYKSLCAAVMICATLVNIQTDRHTHRQHFDQLIRKAQPAELKIGKSSIFSHRVHIFCLFGFTFSRSKMLKMAHLTVRIS